VAPEDVAGRDGGAGSDDAAEQEDGQGKTRSRKASASKPGGKRPGKGNTSVTKRITKKGKTKGIGAQKVAEVTISHETLLRRVKDARGTALVVLAARAIGGGLITILLTGCIMSVLVLAIPPLKFDPLFFVANLAAAAGLVFAAKLASVVSTPEAASGLEILHDSAFIWVDPFRDEKPHLLPYWLEAALWAPMQVLAGAVPFLRVRKATEADCEAAAGFARRAVEEGEVGLGKDFSATSAEASGLRLLLLLRLARLVIEDGEVKARVSGLGQTALFEGSVG
jgi:hypothetical protein